MYQNRSWKVKKEPHRVSKRKMKIRNIAIEINKPSLLLK